MSTVIHNRHVVTNRNSVTKSVLCTEIQMYITVQTCLSMLLLSETLSLKSVLPVLVSVLSSELEWELGLTFSPGSQWVSDFSLSCYCPLYQFIQLPLEKSQYTILLASVRQSVGSLCIGLTWVSIYLLYGALHSVYQCSLLFSISTIEVSTYNLPLFFSLSFILSPPSSQMAHPDSVEGLVLINIDPQARGWMDWAAQKVTVSSIFSQM